MPGLSRPAARRTLWATAALLLPLPFLALANGAVPVARFALLAAVVGTYVLGTDGSSTVTWIVLGLLALHAVGYAVLLAVGVRIVCRVLPDPVPAGPVVALVVVSVVTALAVPIYHTPFDDAVAYTPWLGLFQ